MSPQLIDLNVDLKSFRDEGYNVQIVNGHGGCSAMCLT